MWDAQMYHRYGAQRLQPSLDLARALENKKPRRILDVGCGSGMSTACLVSAFPDAEIVGVDLSQEMLQKAKENLPTVQFLLRDCSKPLSDLGTFDLIFSNAFLQWIPNQETFIARAFAMLRPNGAFAAQIPLAQEMPSFSCILEAEKQFPEKMKQIQPHKYVLHGAGDYYNMLASCTSDISLWITEYCHPMDSPEQILAFLQGAALRPHLEYLEPEEQALFFEDLLTRLKNRYPRQANGKILFPFRRLFVIWEADARIV